MSKVDITVRELVNRVNRGELRLPEMQRRYVWSATRVRDLLDSLYRGYPSGTILVWETDEDVADTDLAVGTVQSPATSQKSLLLDGQQRITSLAAVLEGRPVVVRGRKRPIDILFNLEHPDGPPLEALESEEEDAIIKTIVETEDEESAKRDIQEELKRRTFVVATGSLANDPLWVKVSDIFSLSESQILRRVGITSEDERWDRYAERLKKVKSIENYQYVMNVLDKSMHYEEVTEIFVRVNSLGVKLRGTDLALAQVTAKWRGFMKIMEDFAGSFANKQDGDYIIEKGVAIRLMIVFATKQSRFDTVSRLSKERLEEAWEQTKEGLQFAVNFMRSNGGFDFMQHLGSPFLLIPIAVYAQLRNGNLSHEEEQGLLKWVYYAHMRSHYSMGSSETWLDADLRVIFQKASAERLLDSLQAHVKKFELDKRDVEGKGTNSPLFAMLYIVLKNKDAKDWWSGMNISYRHDGHSHSLQYHHIFPKSLLRDQGYEPRTINQIANMAFITGKANRKISNKAPATYIANDILPKRGTEALASQLVPEDAEMWKLENYESFLDYRQRWITEEINSFLAKFDQ